MGLTFALLALKLVSLAGSIATTAGFVGLFAFKDLLGPHVATLLIGGFLAIAVGEGAAWLVARNAKAKVEA
ncbi:hypothetical protein JOD31_002093 [Methylopila capsulata]|uniref:Uncharacterized protein n=1 Tax=Methylopila capsulata TaxID=61654 RepID=A0A9W6IR26_9HYPH|nr:hypothetical protein [Methylopila capsulata]MBM7851868.1 hypothetical protein [Methylopila capsulata]GLK54933.1 hypothetical protein GCM10008170_09520 [Methylopila capsulata]